MCVITCDARVTYVRAIRKKRFCSFGCTFLSRLLRERDDIFSPYVKSAHQSSAHRLSFPRRERDFPRFRIARYPRMHIEETIGRTFSPDRISRPIHDQLHRIDRPQIHVLLPNVRPSRAYILGFLKI